MMRLASNYNSEQLSPNRLVASGDPSKTVPLASNQNSERSSVTPKHLGSTIGEHQPTWVSPTSLSSPWLRCAATHETTDVGPVSSTDTSPLRALSPRAVLADLQRQAGFQVPPDTNGAGSSGLLCTLQEHGRGPTAEQLLHPLPVDATPENSSVEKPCGFTSPFVIKNTFLEFSDENTA